jgi:hypothetical protein
VPEQTQRQVRQTSMDEGAIAQVLESEDFLDNLRQNFGLERHETQVCEVCGEPNPRPGKVQKGGKERILFECERCEARRPSTNTDVEWLERENALMSKKGVDGVLQTIAGSVDRNQMLSDFDEPQIRNIMIPLHRKVSRELQANWSEYGLESRSAAHKVVTISTNAVWSVFKRAQGGATLDSVAGMGDDKTISKTETGDGDDGGLFSLG